MKITIITPTFPFPNRGLFPGFERYMENLALSLKEKGNDVRIITTFWNGGKRNDIYNGIPILRIKESKTIFGKFGSLFYLNYITFGFNLFRKKNFKFFEDSDVILSAFAMLLSSLFKRKGLKLVSIFLHYDKITSVEDMLTFPMLHYLQKHQYRKNKHVITISEASKKDLIKHYHIKPDNVISIPIGIDTDKFNPSHYSEDIRNQYGQSILFYSGLMVPRKRVPILLKAFQLVLQDIRDASLILAGDGPYLNQYKLLCKKLNIDNNVIFTGFLNENLLLQFYASSDIYILPSELEGFGQVLIEAMASGTPVICADKPPMSEIIDNAGLTFHLNDPIDLAKKILTLLSNKIKLENMGKESIKIAKKYDWNSITEIYMSFLLHSMRSKS